MTTKAKPDFASFVAPEAAKVEVMDRARYAGLSPAAAAELVVVDYHAKKILEASTRRNKVVVMRKILTELGEQGFNLATLTTVGTTAYRAYLRHLVDQGHISENYAYNIVKDWNATVNLLFGERDIKPGQGLKMKGFRQTAKQGDHLTIDEMETMIARLPELRMQNEHYRSALHTYLEVAMSSAGRWDSIGAPETTFSCVDWSKGAIRFPKVKNRDQHDALLTERALRRLQDQRKFLIKHKSWLGEDKTPIMMGPRGKVVTYQTMNDSLHRLAALAHIRKNVTTHVPRKSVGTHMAKENPRLAREQLGITQKVFEKHYNQPTLEDRMDRRDLLPGASATIKSPAERIGALYLDLAKGKISQQEFDQELGRGLLADATKPKAKDQDAAYG
ncbi:MAG: tyrosine-type recombinase/integrase [Candidatus Thermoplasmatota archaeon]|jgi:site-specific recombinase XerD